ncbi:hypothetical protein BASA61_002582 [Batrachochytrium salamandrivorans]|nr:hypothetical protein BASA60_005257 [Batrachochytrium salamandrivorans]KAH6599420.1 hypothetical protein BASA61_002582 [Batrachochytrium salamandrivorans]
MAPSPTATRSPDRSTLSRDHQSRYTGSPDHRHHSHSSSYSQDHLPSLGDTKRETHSMRQPSPQGSRPAKTFMNSEREQMLRRSGPAEGGRAYSGGRDSRGNRTQDEDNQRYDNQNRTSSSYGRDNVRHPHQHQSDYPRDQDQRRGGDGGNSSSQSYRPPGYQEVNTDRRPGEYQHNRAGDSSNYNHTHTKQQSADYFESRRKQREESTVSVWATSPEVLPLRETSPTRPSRSHKSQSSKNKRSRSSKHQSDTETESSDSDSDQSMDARKHRHKKKSRGSSSKSKKSRQSSRKKSRKESKAHKSSHRGSKSKRRGSDDSATDSEVSSGSESASKSADVAERSSASNPIQREKSDAQGNKTEYNSDTLPPDEAENVEDDHMNDRDRLTIQDYWREKEVQHTDDASVGPMPLAVNDKHLTEQDYGGALLAGEGSAMAAFLQSGKRIPRRGEIGLTSDEISKYEDVGFVMSGSRHQRMNAVRIRKENQVISAEEKKALLMFSQEVNMKKEAEIIGTFKELVATKLRGKNVDEDA